MFNPKENLLEQELAVSGLEMNITWAAVGALTSLAGGIFGASQASSQNAAARAAQQQQQAVANEQARITNAYNKATFDADKKDYFAAREFQYETAVKQWKYDTDVQDYRYLQDLKAYGVSVENYGQQTMFNNVAYQAAKESNQAAHSDFLAGIASDAESTLVETVEAEGEAAFGQAGVSRAKRLQSLAARRGRDLSVLRASIKSTTEEFQRGMYDLALQKYGANLQAKANLMIKPDRLPQLVAPVYGPERTFVEPAEVLPGAIPPAQRQSTIMPLIGGVSSFASTVGADTFKWTNS